MQYDQSETPYSILIAARSADLRESVAANFRNNVYRIVFASDGKDAFDKAKSDHFDLVITGITMSKLDGIELLTSLRQLNPDRPVIMVGEGAGEIENVYLRCAALLGAARTFVHPLDPLTFYRNARAVILQSRLKVMQKG
jgi:DNA-binding response OmpR family regulator